MGSAEFRRGRSKDGRRTFRYDTFGDEAFWGGTLALHEAIAGAANGGVGPGVSPDDGARGRPEGRRRRAARRRSRRRSRQGRSTSTIPATTLALLQARRGRRRDAGSSTETARSTSIGIQCALCHSTVDDSFAPGIGQRLDGWPNRDLNVGAIVALAPDLSPFPTLLGVDEATVRAVLDSWGPGKFDAELFLDGKAFRPDGKTAATLLPPAFGLAGVNLHT